MAANFRDGPCLVTACPGSGKTRTVVERTARLILGGVPGSQILSITFTNKAAEEMKDRVVKRIGPLPAGMFIGTFHKLCCQSLRFHGSVLGYGKNMTILMEDDQEDSVAQISRQQGYELTKPQIKSIVWNVNDARENLETDSQMHDRFDSLEPHWFGIANEYILRLRRNSQIDFSGMISETVRLFTEHSSVLERAHAKWKYLQVDEVQDTNLAQFRLVQLLSQNTKNVFVVGDLDQSIYGWRGARSENIVEFQNLYAGTKVISLGKNYRSTPQIVAVADKLIKYNNGRIAAEFSTDNPPGAPVACKQFNSDLDEANYVAQSIRALIASKKYTAKDIAVFYRINSMSRAIEMAMVRSHLPHTVIGSRSFFDRREIRDSMAMMRFLVNPKDGMAFHRIANRPKRGLGDVTIGKIENYATTQNVSIIEACKALDFKSEAVREGLHEIGKAFDADLTGKSVAQCLDHLHKELRYEEFLRDDKETYQERKYNVDSLFEELALFGNKGGDTAAYLEQAALFSASDKSADGNAVSLMSLHASKGLEFPVVFMLGCEQNILPHKKAMDDREDGLEEERRLCYVGMTRAQKFLHVTYCTRRQDGFAARQGDVRYKTVRPSQFLFEAGLLKVPSKTTTGDNEYSASRPQF